MTHYTVAAGGGHGDTDDVARLHVELESKDQELREKDQIIDKLVIKLSKYNMLLLLFFNMC